MANGWALGNFAGEFAPARRLTLRSSNLVYFREPTLRTQLDMSVCGPKPNMSPLSSACAPWPILERRPASRSQGSDPVWPLRLWLALLNSANRLADHIKDKARLRQHGT